MWDERCCRPGTDRLPELSPSNHSLVTPPVPVYRYWLDGSILAIDDLGGPVAVTVAAEYVLLEIEGQIGSLSDYYVVYRDREGVWDGLVRREGKLLICPLSAPTYQAAKDKLNQRVEQWGELTVRYEPAGD